MDGLLYFALLALFYFVIETIITALVTKQFRIKGANVEKASLIVLFSWALSVFLSLPLLFVVAQGSDFYSGARIFLGFVATTIVLKNMFPVPWGRALLVGAVSTLLFELVMSLFWQVQGGM